MKTIRKSSAFIACLIVSGLLLQAQTKVKINPEHHLTEVEGWGVSLCWWANMVGKWNNEARIDEIVDLLTAPDKLNMNVFRYNIGGGDNPAHNHLTPRARVPGFKASENAAYNWDADAAQRKIMLKIKAKRPDAIFEAFSNSPPYWMTYSLCTSGQSGTRLDNLKPEYYDAFCDYLIDVCKYYKNTHGIEFKTLEPFNEPASGYWNKPNSGDQEGCNFTAASQINLIRKLYPKLQASGLNTVISASDENSLGQYVSSTRAYINAGDIIDKIGQLNVHTYSPNDEERIESRDLANSTGKGFWQSESGPFNLGNHDGLPIFIRLQQRLFSDMNVMRPTVWCDWQFMEEGDANWAWCLIRGSFANETFTPQKNLYVRMQATRFVKQGYTIIESGNKDVLAAISPDRNELVISLINLTGSTRSFEFNLSGFYPVKDPVKVYRTSSSENCNALADMNVAGSVLSYNASNQTVTTFVLKTQPVFHGMYRVTEEITFEDGKMDGFSGTNLLIVKNQQKNKLNASENCLSGNFDGGEKIVYRFEKPFIPSGKFRYLHVMCFNPTVETPPETQQTDDGVFQLDAWKEWEDLVFDLNKYATLDELTFTSIPGTCIDNMVINNLPNPRSVTQKSPVFDFESAAGIPLYEFRNTMEKKSSGSIESNSDLTGLNPLGKIFRYVLPPVENTANAEDAMVIRLSSPLLITDATRYLHFMIKSSMTNRVGISVLSVSQSSTFTQNRWVDAVFDLYSLKGEIVREIQISPHGQRGLNTIVHLDNIFFNSDATARTYKYVAPENNSTYIIISRKSLCALSPSGTGVIQDNLDMTLSDETQQWLFTKVSGGYTITNISNKMIITDDGAYPLSLKSGTASGQVFTINHLGDGYVNIVSSRGLSFDVEGESASAGARIGLWAFGTSNNTHRQWSLVEVREEDDDDDNPYKANANLSFLGVNQATLTPLFDPAVIDYAIEVENKTSIVTIVATPENPKATVTGTGTRTLREGINAINLVVTAQDKITTKNYTILVNRIPPPEIISSTEDHRGQATTVYPNPAKDQIVISGLQIGGTLTVYDAAGRQILRRNIASPQETIDLNALSSGNYFINIIDRKKEKTIKIIVE